MYKKTTLFLILIVSLLSCKTSQKENSEQPSKLKIAKKYYNALDNSDLTEMASIVSDSIVVRENADDYEERFSNDGYLVWLDWDSVFEPTYKILDIAQENDMVKAKISKIDKRISFLTLEPIVWNEIIRFDTQKIVAIERTGYDVFDVQKFINKRDSLVRWIDTNHPELSGFLYPQTKKQGLKYLKAIKLYTNK